jgi:hypothetical protein
MRLVIPPLDVGNGIGEYGREFPDAVFLDEEFEILRNRVLVAIEGCGICMVFPNSPMFIV